MKHIFVRLARPEENQTFTEWSLSNPFFDSKVPLYPTTTTRVAFDKSGPMMFMPVQRPLMLEAAAIRPGLDPLEVALAFKEITQDCVTNAWDSGRGEIYFLGSHPETNIFAEKQLFEKVNLPVYRLKVYEIQKP